MQASTIPETLQLLRRGFASGRTRQLDWRRGQLQALQHMLSEQEPTLFAALEADLGKPACEAFTSETGFVAAEAGYALRRLGRWARPKRVPTGLPNMPGYARVVPEPLGTVLIMAPWNYPLMLTLSPLVGALAAGNCALLKPSELAPATSTALAELIPRYLDPQAVQVVEGGADISQALLAERYDHIFYTGGSQVAQIVMHAASDHLTPVTLELGGKSPCIVAADADIKIAARRIAWGKCLNAGQTCVAPDYLLIHPSVKDSFVSEFAGNIRRFYGDDPRQSPDYPRIVNERHFQRLLGLMQEGEIVVGGDSHAEDRFIAPTLLQDLPAGSLALQDEIFGPILPIIEIDDIDAAIAYINERPKPLALYLFTRDSAAERKVVSSTSSGSMCVNDVVVQLAVPELPFGGVGASGMGSYHGHASFKTFSHLKPVLTKSYFGEVPLRYPPFSADKLRWLRRFL